VNDATSTTHTEPPRVSIVIPAYEEADNIVPVLDRIFEAVTLPCEVLVVFDDESDSTVPVLTEYCKRAPLLIPTLNENGPGPASAIRTGFEKSSAPVVVVTMADGCDDAGQIDQLALLVERGVVIAAASRYMKSGQQVGEPSMKSFLAKWSGRSLRFLARVGITDSTNSFKAYDREFVESVGIESTNGFEIGIELVAKARRCRRMMAEIPTIWLDREHGQSNFKTMQWIPSYLRWYRFAFGPKLTPDEILKRAR
jgi:glycosyltransferase involved in cell wall biosynthesis